MASCEPDNDVKDTKREERRKQVMLGDLPYDFLRVTSINSTQQLSLDEQTAIALQHKFAVGPTPSGRLNISIVEAKLNKNYGLARMDPYARLRINGLVYETSTDYNGARNPRWNRNFNCLYGYDTTDAKIQIEIFDECAFHLDERIAWGSYDIPDTVLQGVTLNEWVELSGKLGEGKEGSINLIISCQPVQPGSLMFSKDTMITIVPYLPKENEDAKQVYSPPAEEPIQIPEEDMKQVIEMFPNMDEEIVKAIMESNRGNKDHAINALLELSDTS